MRAHPAVLSAEDLLEQAWDEHTDPFSNIVSVTISRLRRKLGEPPVISTIPNVGYHLMDPQPDTPPVVADNYAARHAGLPVPADAAFWTLVQGPSPQTAGKDGAPRR
jgi:DNA-binding winged helix-turn-helix (wHTH) protein